MTRYRNTFWCDGCGVEIRWVPLLKGERHFCCQECAEGQVCDCSQWSELDLDFRLEEQNALPAFISPLD